MLGLSRVVWDMRWSWSGLLHHMCTGSSLRHRSGCVFADMSWRIFWKWVSIRLHIYHKKNTQKRRNTKTTYNSSQKRGQHQLIDTKCISYQEPRTSVIKSDWRRWMGSDKWFHCRDGLFLTLCSGCEKPQRDKQCHQDSDFNIIFLLHYVTMKAAESLTTLSKKWKFAIASRGGSEWAGMKQQQRWASDNNGIGAKKKNRISSLCVMIGKWKCWRR